MSRYAISANLSLLRNSAYPSTESTSSSEASKEEFQISLKKRTPTAARPDQIIFPNADIGAPVAHVHGTIAEDVSRLDDRD
jgi:hypothetical protein